MPFYCKSGEGHNNIKCNSTEASKSLFNGGWGLPFWRNISFNTYDQLIRWAEVRDCNWVTCGDCWDRLWVHENYNSGNGAQIPELQNGKLKCDQKSSCSGVFCADKNELRANCCSFSMLGAVRGWNLDLSLPLIPILQIFRFEMSNCERSSLGMIWLASFFPSRINQSIYIWRVKP